MVRGDPLILATCAKVTIQSRLKTPPSAFKKVIHDNSVCITVYIVVRVLK